MAIAAGVAKSVAFKKETTWGTAAGSSGSAYLRRVTSDLSLKKDTYQSEEIRTDMQVADMRHGVKSVEGSLAGELSPGSYQTLIAAAVRQAFQTAITSTALTNVTAATGPITFTRASGSFLTDGFKLFMVVRWTGWATTGAVNNSRNFLITSLTAAVMGGVFLDGTAGGAKASGDSVTCLEVGKHTFVPQTSHTDDSFSIEHFYTDIAQSELFLGCKISEMAIELPPTGLGKVTFNFVGRDMQTAGAQYYSSPSAAGTTGVVAAVNGAAYLGGAAIALITGLNMSLKGNPTMEPVVGSNLYPAITMGRVTVDGQITVMFSSAAERDYFLNETEVSLAVVLTTGSGATADFISLVLPRVKLGSADKDDGEKSLIQTMSFTALLNSAGGSGTSSEKTTIWVQDSQAA